MIDFSTLQGLTIPEGVVTQITDASGRVLWAVQIESGEPIVLEVAKITSDTYAASTTYTGEQFILLDIYPKTNGTVKVTYGGLTKTITDTSGAAEPNAQEVFFGTFNGVSDEVETPASGELIIEGALNGFAVGNYSKTAKNGGAYCSCITAVHDWGGMSSIHNCAFYECNDLTIDAIPEGITSIGDMAFLMTSSAKMYHGKITLPSTLQSLYGTAFTTESVVDEGVYGGYIRDMVMLSTTPPTLLGMDNVTLLPAAFDLNYGLILVPKGCVEAYKAADVWSNYAERIFEVGRIVFAISSSAYFADDGMTWAEWVESEYNNDGVYIMNDKIHVMLSASVKTIVDVKPYDIIVSRHRYSYN